MNRLMARLAAVAALCAGPSWVYSTDARSERDGLHIPQAVDAVPDRPVTPRDLLALRDLGGVGGRGLSVSPDGAYAAFELHQADLEANDYRVAWFVVATARRGKPINVGDGGDARLFGSVGDHPVTTSGAWISQTPQWSPDGHWIAYLRRADARTQVWRSWRDGGVQEQLTRHPADVDDFVWTADGSRILFRVGTAQSVKRNALMREAHQGFLLDERFAPYTSLARPVWPCELLPPIGTTPWSYEEYFEPCPLAVWTYEVSTGVEREATPEERAEYEARTQPSDLARRPEVRLVEYTPDRARVAWLEAVHSLQRGVRAPLTVFASYSPDISGAIMCEAPQCTGQMRKLWWSRDRTQIHFLRAEGVNYASQGLYTWLLRSRRVRTVLQTDDLLAGCSMARDALVCFREAATHPRTIVSIDLRSGSLETLVDPNLEFQRIRLSDATKLVWKNAFGQETLGHVVKPLDYEAGRRYPLVITTYESRGFLRGGTGDEYPVQAFAANGFLVLSFEIPQDWKIAATEPTWDDVSRKSRQDAYDKRMAQSSLEAGIDLLDQMGLIDRERVGLSGLSYGAETTHYALLHSDLIAAAAASGPGWDPIVYYLLPAPGRRLYETLGFGDPGGPAAAHWQRLSVALNPERIHTPLLIQAADSEYLLTLQTFTALREAGKPVEIFVFPDEYHIKWQPKHRLTIYERNIDWFNYWLRGIEDPDSAKADQYRRWRALRVLHAAAPKQSKAPR